MGTNVFFNNFEEPNEQRLLEDLIEESIKIYGMDGYYICRTEGVYDKIFGEDTQPIYSRAFMLEYYLKDIFGYEGDREFISKFAGLEIRDQIKISISRRSFNTEVGNIMNFVRPRENDLIYFPLQKKTFRIMFVNQFEMFYQLGSLNTWEITAELFEYSNEVFRTGIPEIDILQKKFSHNLWDWALLDENNNPLVDESNNVLLVDKYSITRIDPIADNDELTGKANTIIDWTDNDPFTDVINRNI